MAVAVGNLFSGLKNKVRSVYNNFFYDGSEAPTPPMQEEYYGAQEQSNVQQPQQNVSYGVYQQQDYAHSGYQQAYSQNGYAQQPYGQNPYQPQPAPQQPQPVSQAQAQPQGRSRRAQHKAFQQQSKVVDFGAYQQQNHPEQAQPAAEESEKQNSGSLLSARVINARSMGDCRSAITLLRNGDAVLIVLENITDPTEMRRLVDTLSGACYSLTATITKVSRYGVYLLAPQSLAVFADQMTNQMNSGPVRAQSRAYQPGVPGAQPQPQRVNYTAQPQRQPAPQQANPYAGMQGFTQRSAIQEEAPQDFYQRPMPQQVQTMGFSAQPTAYGYAPDEPGAAAQ